MNTDTKTEYIYKDLTYKIIGCFYEVHKELGNIHKEILYHNALALEFNRQNIPFVEERPIKITYKSVGVGVYRPDFIVDDKVIVEIKATPYITKPMQDQIYYYAKGTKYKLVLLANFGSVKVGVKRLIYT